MVYVFMFVSSAKLLNQCASIIIKLVVVYCTVTTGETGDTGATGATGQRHNVSKEATTKKPTPDRPCVGRPGKQLSI